MKKRFALLFTTCLLAATSMLQAQSYIGYSFNNYETVAGATFNPASIAGSNYKVDINIFSMNAAVGSNAYSFTRSSLFKMNFSNWTEGRDYTKNNSSDPKDLWNNFDVLGPSVMVALTPKYSIALTSRVRFMMNEDNLSNDIFQLIGNDKSNAIFGQTFTQNDLKVEAHGFADFGLSFAGVIFDDGQHKIKGGLTGKWVLGLGAGSMRGDRINVNLINSSTIGQITGTGSLSYSGGIDALINDDFNGGVTDYIDARGFGMDLGAVYEWTSSANRKKADEGAWFSPTTYKLRLAVSATDIGKLKYDVSKNSGSYTVNIPPGTITDIFELNGRSVDEYIDDLKGKGYLVENAPRGLNVSLPTMLRTNVDWQAWKRLYVNFDGSFNLIGNNSVGAHYNSTFALTPRYESKWFSAYSPVSYNTKKEVNWGIGFNVGVFFVGSGSVLSNLVRNNIEATDLHFGLHIPIFRGKKVAAKPAVQEPMVVEQVETVVEAPPAPVVVTPVPVPVPVQAIPEERPEPVPAPVIDTKVKKEVDLLARSIYFVSGSDWLLLESHEPLNKIADILIESPDVLLDIQGYTDNTGSAKRNLELSQQRAERVRNYLSEKGISDVRMTATGFGSKNPVADNGTTAGRAKNRRVELKLHY